MKKILIVDDHADIRRLIRMTLEFEDYEIAEARDGESALEVATRLQPDLVLLDVMMPGHMSGLEVCRELRSALPGDSVHIVMLSARGRACDRQAGLAAGADTYLVKPFSPLQLIDTISQLWAEA